MALTWSADCVLRSKATKAAEGDNPAINNPTNETFKITDIKLYVPVVTSSTQDDNKLLEQLKIGFKRTIKWNKNRSEMSNQSKKGNWKNVDVLIDGKSFFDIPIKNKKETYKAIDEMGRNNDYTTGNLLDYEYFSKHYILIAT